MRTNKPNVLEGIFKTKSPLFKNGLITFEVSPTNKKSMDNVEYNITTVSVYDGRLYGKLLAFLPDLTFDYSKPKYNIYDKENDKYVIALTQRFNIYNFRDSEAVYFISATSFYKISNSPKETKPESLEKIVSDSFQRLIKASIEDELINFYGINPDYVSEYPTSKIVSQILEDLQS